MTVASSPEPPATIEHANTTTDIDSDDSDNDHEGRYQLKKIAYMYHKQIDLFSLRAAAEARGEPEPEPATRAQLDFSKSPSPRKPGLANHKTEKSLSLECNPSLSHEDITLGSNGMFKTCLDVRSQVFPWDESHFRWRRCRRKARLHMTYF